MEEVVEYPIRHRPVMPCRLDCRVHIEPSNHICDLFVREGVPCAHVTKIKWNTNLYDRWCTLPHDMMSLVCHIVSALTLIKSLRSCAQSMPSSKYEAPNVSHHDSPRVDASGE